MFLVYPKYFKHKQQLSISDIATYLAAQLIQTVYYIQEGTFSPFVQIDAREAVDLAQTILLATSCKRINVAVSCKCRMRIFVELDFGLATCLK